MLTGPSFQRWDLSVFKNLKLRGDNMYLQFRAETFNLFNRTNFNAVNTNIASATLGTVAAAKSVDGGNLK